MPLVNPACESHFFARFNSLNLAFRLKSPKKPSWLYRLSLKSNLVFLLTNSQHLTNSKIPNQVKEVIWDEKTPEEYAKSRFEQVRKNPVSLAVRVWPEIRQFDGERRRMIEQVGFLLSRIDKHLKAMRCQILIVLLPDPAQLQAFYKMQTNLLQQSIPDYQFEWGWSQRALREKLKALEIPFIEPQYASDELESMFVPLDGHVSGKAFGLIAKRIAEEFSLRNHSDLP